MVKVIAAILACAGIARAEDELFGTRRAGVAKVESARELLSLERRAVVPDAPGPAASRAAVFGDKGSHFWIIGGGIADNLSGSTDYNLRGAWSYFVIRDVEFSLEANLWYFDQPGDNTFGLNPAFLFRWHFYKPGDWTVYADVGIGLLFASDDTPTGGTQFNFMPRLGAGVTYKLDEEGDRLQVGLRWHHISNARIEGDFNNPARDGVMLYGGVMIPF